MNNLFQQLEQWNDADEFTKCIEAIETIPKDQWDYRIAFALARALENYAIIGDHGKGTSRGKGTKALLRAIDVLESVREEGEAKAEWNMRMAYAYQYLSAQEEKAIPYAQRWAELDSGDENAEMVIQECREEIQKQKQREEGVPDGLLKKIEQWNDADEYVKCIQVIEAIPENERGYQLTLLLGRAYSNLAVCGDHGERRGEDDDSVDKQTLAHALEIFKSIREKGESDPLWNSRIAFALYMTEGCEAEALEYAKKWLALDPGSENAKELMNDCADYLRQEERREWSERLDMYGQSEMEAIESHIETHFGKFDWVMHETKPGEYVHLEICVIPPREDHNYYTLVTMGMGAYTMNAPKKDEARAELLLNLPPDWKLGEDAWEDEHWFWPVGILKALARYPMLHDTWFGWGHTVYGSEDSYTDNTKLCGVVLLSPGVFGDPASICTLPGGEKVNFYQVIPLYREEIEFKREHDMDRLLEKFPDELLEVIDPTRLNVITDAEIISQRFAQWETVEHNPYELKNVEAVSRNEPFEGVDFTNFWDDCDYAKKEYIEPAPSDELIAEIEAELGYKLPASYIWLMKQHNGGIPVNTCFPTHTPTSWAEDHIAITGIMGIGRDKAYSICGELGSQFMIDEWEYPAIGVAICDCPSAGHDMIFLDYRECGPQGEPKVVHIDQENDYAITLLADNFEEFIRGLVGEETFEEEDGCEDNATNNANAIELNTQKYPCIPYEKGEELFLDPDDSNIPFWFDVSANLTGDDQAMAAVASALDKADELAEEAKAFLKDILANEDGEYYGIVSYFMEFHRDELEEDSVKELFSADDPSTLTLMEMVDYLQINRFGSFLDEKANKQMFIMDLTFGPKITDELLVIYYNLDGQIVNISHES